MLYLRSKIVHFCYCCASSWLNYCKCRFLCTNSHLWPGTRITCVHNVTNECSFFSFHARVLVCFSYMIESIPVKSTENGIITCGRGRCLQEKMNGVVIGWRVQLIIFFFSNASMFWPWDSLLTWTTIYLFPLISPSI